MSNAVADEERTLTALFERTSLPVTTSHMPAFLALFLFDWVFLSFAAAGSRPTRTWPVLALYQVRCRVAPRSESMALPPSPPAAPSAMHEPMMWRGEGACGASDDDDKDKDEMDESKPLLSLG